MPSPCFHNAGHLPCGGASTPLSAPLCDASPANVLMFMKVQRQRGG